jgi:3-oxoacyl-[acyl-carrier protein] reductase
MIDLGLEGQRAVVVGAGYRADRAGHGRGSALRLAEAGARVACVDINEGRAAAIVAEIEAAGGSARAIIGDVTDSSQAMGIIDEAVSALGGIDICVDIVGDVRWSAAVDCSDDDWNWGILNNLSHVFYVFRAVGRRMISQGSSGSLTAISSVDGIQASTLHAPYGAAKAGVISLVRTFADELGQHGIRVNAVAPGNVGYGNWDAPGVPYGTNPINSLAPPRGQDIANAVLFLSSDLAARVTGQTLVVDGGALIKSRWGVSLDDAAARNQVASSSGP